MSMLTKYNLSACEPEWYSIITDLLLLKIWFLKTLTMQYVPYQMKITVGLENPDSHNYRREFHVQFKNLGDKTLNKKKLSDIYIIQKLKILPNSLGWSKIYDDNSYEKGQWIYI